MWDSDPHDEELTEPGKAVAPTGTSSRAEPGLSSETAPSLERWKGKVAGRPSVLRSALSLAISSAHACLWVAEALEEVLRDCWLPSGSATRWGHSLTVPTSLQLAKYWEAFLPEAKAIS